MEVCLLDYRFLRAKPSMVAAVGMYTARRMLEGDWVCCFRHVPFTTADVRLCRTTHLSFTQTIPDLNWNQAMNLFSKPSRPLLLAKRTLTESIRIKGSSRRACSLVNGPKTTGRLSSHRRNSRQSNFPRTPDTGRICVSMTSNRAEYRDCSQY
jgi:Cyclin, C-terminal domain